VNLRNNLNLLLRKFGWNISRFTPASHPLAKRKWLMQRYEIDTILDVGANTGQYARQVRNELGYKNHIISFEPLKDAFSKLKYSAAADPLWECHNFALGDKNETTTINVSANSYSSSILAMLPKHLKSAPDSRYVTQEEITAKTIDSIFDNLCSRSHHVWLKIDTQGFEERVLAGADRSLAKIDTVQIEMSLVPLYSGEFLFIDLFSLMSQRGYTLIALENGIHDKNTGQILQVDGIYHRIQNI
jgi:FkbM family methyltransferase